MKRLLCIIMTCVVLISLCARRKDAGSAAKPPVSSLKDAVNLCAAIGSGAMDTEAEMTEAQRTALAGFTVRLFRECNESGNINISNVIHKTCVSVDRNGAKAAASAVSTAATTAFMPEAEPPGVFPVGHQKKTKIKIQEKWPFQTPILLNFRFTYFNIYNLCIFGRFFTLFCIL